MSQQVTPLKENFNAGEFGGRMAARVQFDKYQNAGAIYQNILPLPQGGYTYRPGFRYVANAKSNSVRPWLIRFEFSTTQSYVLEFGEQALRFYRNQAPIVAPNTDAIVTNGSFPSNITGWTARNTGTGAIAWDGTNFDMDLQGAGAGNEARAYQVITTTNLNAECVVAFKVVGDAGDQVIVRAGSAAGGSQYLSDSKKDAGWHTIQFTPTASPFYLEFENGENKTISIDDVSVIDNTPIEIPTPWSEVDMPNVGYGGAKDVLYFCIGGAIRVYRLERHGHSSWSLLNVLFEDGPYLNQNVTATTLALSTVTGNGVTVTASSIVGINDDKGFQSTDVGRLIRFKSTDWTWMQITAVGSTTSVTVDIKGADAAATTAVTTWRLGEWCDAKGWPSVVGLIQQRLGFAATNENPQKFWLSKSADIENFADEDVKGIVQDDSSINYTPASTQANPIQWLVMRKKPVIGTLGGEWTLSSQGAALTPTDITADFEVSGGVAKIPPVDVRNRLLFVQAQNRKVVEFADIFQSNGVAGYDDFDLTLLNSRVLTGGITQLAFAQEPDSIIWSVRSDGQMPTLTYTPEQNVVGWARQIHGGSFQGGDAVIESACSIPGQNGAGQFKDSSGRHEVWVAVKQEINGATVRYIEVLEKTYNGDEDLQQDAFYVDSGLTLDVPLTVTGITKANPGIITLADASSLSNGGLVRLVRVKGMTEVNKLTFQVAGLVGNSFNLTDKDGVNVDTSAYATYAAAGECRKMVTVISGANHLEGETVKIFADGMVQTDKTVSSGSITLDQAASLVHIGLPYERRWKSLKIAYGSPSGTAVGKQKNIADLVMVLLEAAEGSISVATEDSDGVNAFTELDLRKQVSDAYVPFFTGEVRLGIQAGWDEDLRLILKTTSPTCATVLALAPDLETV